MSRRKLLLVLSTTVPLLMFGATIGVAAPKDFSICYEVPRTGGAYGLCRAGVAVGCVDGTGNPQACANIEDHFLTVTNESAPWVCPCDFDQVPKETPPWGIEGSYVEILCEDVLDNGVFQYREINDFLIPFETLLRAGEHPTINGTLSCAFTVDGDAYEFSNLDEPQNVNCLSKMTVATHEHSPYR